MPRVLIATTPFGKVDQASLDVLKDAGFECVLNPHGRCLSEEELIGLVPNVDALVAGTEPITSRVFDSAPRLRIISRVGVGLDNVDLLAARLRNLAVAYTPEAPCNAVAEITVGLMLCLARGIHQANSLAHAGQWDRILGWRLGDLRIGVVGVGRIGKTLIHLLKGFGGSVLANDLSPSDLPYNVEWVDKETLYRRADIVTLHVPLTPQTRGLIGSAELALMKPSAALVNTSRGGVVDEAALAQALRTMRLRAAAIDVFCDEPYNGELARLNNCLITCHMGSMAADCRFRMEYEAARNVVSFFRGDPLKQFVPEFEYELRRADFQT